MRVHHCVPAVPLPGSTREQEVRAGLASGPRPTQQDVSAVLPPPEPVRTSIYWTSGHVFGTSGATQFHKRDPDTDGWGYYNFNHYEPKAKTASVRPKGECAYCHMASAKKDDVRTQFYPMLEDIAKKVGG
jgi:hypothetical protein